MGVSCKFSLKPSHLGWWFLRRHESTPFIDLSPPATCPQEALEMYQVLPHLAAECCLGKSWWICLPNRPSVYPTKRIEHDLIIGIFSTIIININVTETIFTKNLCVFFSDKHRSAHHEVGCTPALTIGVRDSDQLFARGGTGWMDVGSPKWLVYHGQSPIKKWMRTGGTTMT